jgi:hypothetical protein
VADRDERQERERRAEDLRRAIEGHAGAEAGDRPRPRRPHESVEEEMREESERVEPDEDEEDDDEDVAEER